MLRLTLPTASNSCSNVCSIAWTMKPGAQQNGMISQQVSKVEDKIDGSKAESVEKMRDEKGKLIGARIKNADGSVREVKIH